MKNNMSHEAIKKLGKAIATKLLAYGAELYHIKT